MSGKIGDRIKICRKNAGITQKELADMAGISLMSIRRYENNERQPRIDHIKKIASILKVSISELMEYENVDGKFYGKEAPQEMQEKFMKRMTDHKTDYKSEMNRHLDMLNDQGQQEAVKRVEDLTYNPKYRKGAQD